MKLLRRMAVGITPAMALALAGAGIGVGQQGSGRAPAVPTMPTMTQPSLPPLVDDTNSAGLGNIEAQQARLRNNDRQKQLVDDTVKLLNLANELKADVDKSSKDTLSLDVIRKADEIERLAHNVKEKMKGS
jgi:hypothetical protein